MKKALMVIFFLFIWTFSAMASDVTATISSAPGADGSWTSHISSSRNSRTGYLNIHVYGSSWSATVTLQRQFEGDSNWYDVQTWTANAEAQLYDMEGGIRYRIGVDNGDFTSGSVTVRLSK